MADPQHNDGQSWFWWASAICAGVSLAVVLCLILYRIRIVVVPFAAGFVVAYVLDPVLDRLEARGWTRRRAVWTVMGLLLSVLVLGGALLVPRVVGEVGDAWENRELYVDRASDYYQRAVAKAEAVVGQYLPERGEASDYLHEQEKHLRDWADANKGRFAAWVGSLTLQTAGMIMLVVLGMLIAFHFMLVIDPLRQGVQGLFLSEAQSHEVDDLITRVNRMLGAYVRGMASVSILVGIVTALGLWIAGLCLGTQYALVIGLLAGITYAVPWVGQTVSAGTAFFFGLVTADHHALAAALVCAGIVIVVNQVADNVLMPRIVGDQVGLHPLVVLFAIMAGFQLWGIVGMLVAVPVAASIRIALRRWIPIVAEDEKKTTGLPRLDAAKLVESTRDAMQRLMSAGRRHPAGRDRTEGAEAKNEAD